MALPEPCFTHTIQDNIQWILRYHIFNFKRFTPGRRKATERVIHNATHFIWPTTSRKPRVTKPEAKTFCFHSALLPLAEPKRFEHLCYGSETKFKDMSMLNLSNQAAVEALCSGTYLENYLDTIESLPDDLQRNVTLLRELDIQSRGMLSYLFRLQACSPV